MTGKPKKFGRRPKKLGGGRPLCPDVKPPLHARSVYYSLYTTAAATAIRCCIVQSLMLEADVRGGGRGG